MELRKVRTNQISELRELCYKAYTQNFADHWNDNGLALYLEHEFGNERLTRELQHPSTDYYFMVSKERAVGFIKINYNSYSVLSPLDNCELEKIYLLTQYKGLGFGKLAVKRLITELEQRGKKLMFLCVIDTNQSSIAFYKKLGFEFHSKTRLDIPLFKEELKGMERMCLKIGSHSSS